MSLIELTADLWLLVAAIGLALAVQQTGLPVLGQGASVAAGAYGTALLAPLLPLPLAAALAVLLAGVAVQLLGAAATRLTAGALALGTWALTWLVREGLTAFPLGEGGAPEVLLPQPVRLVSPSLGVAATLTPGWQVALAAAAAVTALGLTRRALRGPLGLQLAAVRAGPALASTLGVDVAARRRGVLAVAAALGALGGVGMIVLQGVVGPSDVGPLLSLQLLAAVLVGGRAWWGPLVGIAVLKVALVVADPSVAAALLLAGGLLREPIGGLLARGRVPGPEEDPPPAGDPRPSRHGGSVRVDRPRGAAAANATPALRARGLRVVFGGLSALDGVNLDLHAGQVHAVIGPNGSGKTTLLRVLAGALPATTGSIELSGRVLGRLAEADRVRAGVARSPQRTLLLAGFGVRREVEVATPTGVLAGLRHLLGARSARADATARADAVDEALQLTGLTERGLQGGAVPVKSAAMPTREQRLLQLARVAATGAAVLLLDEPAAGVAGGGAGLAELTSALRRLAESGRAVLLIEHDMRLVSAVADRVSVLVEGRIVAAGSPADVLADPAVRTAYLGG